MTLGCVDLDKSNSHLLDRNNERPGATLPEYRFQINHIQRQTGLHVKRKESHYLDSLQTLL